MVLPSQAVAVEEAAEVTWLLLRSMMTCRLLLHRPSRRGRVGDEGKEDARLHHSHQHNMNP